MPFLIVDVTCNWKNIKKNDGCIKT